MNPLLQSIPIVRDRLPPTALPTADRLLTRQLSRLPNRLLSQQFFRLLDRLLARQLSRLLDRLLA
jgi:hypothetical protein